MGFQEAYAQIRTELQALFSTYNEIDNPYDLSAVAKINLKTAYGITIGPGNNTTIAVCGRADITRDFGIVLCRAIFATKENQTARITAEKALFEDLTSIVTTFESKIPNVTLARYVSDDGIDFLNGNEYNYLILRSTFSVKYSETL